MPHNLDDTVALLARTPAALNALFRDLPETWTHRDEGDGTWNAVAVVGHLIHGERTDWIPRARMILQYGESKTFVPFDMQGHLREIEGKSLPQLLDEFARLRTDDLFELRAWKLQPADLERRGMHPELGSVTLDQHLSTWAAHDLTHLHQISRVLAHQYRDAVGPWSQYLGVLHCSGHSSK
ncbi:MAG TPA: DinB family protein [Candidatus Eisenbacteria bacterium]|nr:DinB family protein [Candidatus Eisenbacteria bacterium]